MENKSFLKMSAKNCYGNRDLPNNEEHESPSIEPKVKLRTFVCPWKNLSEFNKVYKLLFGLSDIPEQRLENWRLAVKELDIWILRRGELCPAAVHATRVMVDALLKDNLYSTMENQIFYSNAILRFMNYMSSVMHTPIGHITMYDKAKELGMPSFLVDLRHICAHGEVMPSINILHKAACYCFKWLHQFYWTKQKKIVGNVLVQNITLGQAIVQCEIEFSSLTDVLDSAIYVYTKDVSCTVKIAKRYLPKSRFQTLNDYCKERKNIDIYLINSILMKLQNLIQNDLKLQSSPTICLEFLTKMYYFFNFIGDHNRNNENLSNKLIQATQPLFRLMAIYNILEHFFEHLLRIVENPNSFERKRISAAFWALRLAEGFRLAFRCRNMYKSELEKGKSTTEESLDPQNIFLTTELVRELVYYCIDIKRRNVIILYDTMQRPWTWTFDCTFLQDRFNYINEHTTEIIKCLQPLIVPMLKFEDINLLNKLTDFYMNTEMAEKEDVSNASDNNVYTCDHLFNFENGLSEGEERISESEEEMAEGVVNKSTSLSTENSTSIWSRLDKNDGEIDWRQSPIGVTPWN